jgi:hypothetical protein
MNVFLVQILDHLLHKDEIILDITFFMKVVWFMEIK